MNDKTIVLIIGVIAGLLVACIAGMFMLAANAPPKAEVTSAGPPAGALIEADVTEEYINRTFLDTVATASSSLPLADGRVDILSGGRLKFTALLDTPIGLMTTGGALEIGVRDGELAFHITEVRVGEVPLTALASPFLSSIESQINEEANKQLAERTALAKVKLLGVMSDETQLKFFLAAK